MNQLLLSPNKLRKKNVLVLLFLVLGVSALFAQTYGDANQDGSVNIIDALATAQYFVGLSVPVFNTVNADVDGNGNVTIVDALLIAQYSVGLITVFPVQAQGSDPVAAFTISNTVPAVNASVSFNASGSYDPDGTIISYSWDFDDGTTAAGVSVTHAFATMEDFKVKLTVTDNSNKTKKLTKKVFVGRPQGWTEKTHHKSADGDYDMVFPVNKVNRIDIEISPENYQIMEDDLAVRQMFDTSQPPYVTSTVKFNGYTWTNVGVRYKGQSSLVTPKQTNRHKIGLHLNFDKFEDTYPEINDQRFYGFEELLCNSNWFDSAFLRDYICTDIFLNGGVRTARCSYYRIFINAGSGPVYWGLYTVFEDHADELLKTQFEDSTGNLYKPEKEGADLKVYTESAFIKKTNEEAADYSDVIAFVAALNASRTDAAAWRANLEATFDVNVFLRWLAINTSMVNADAYGITMQNYFLYQDLANGGRLVWIPWDFTGALNIVDIPGWFKTFSLSLDEVTDAWPLIRYLMDDPVYRNIYHEEMRTALTTCLTAADVIAEMRRVHTMIRPYVVGSEGETSTYSYLTNGAAEFDNALETLVNHFTNREIDIAAYLNSL